MNLITARKGEAHVTPQDDASIYRAIVGKSSGIFGWSDGFEPTVVSNNQISIASGLGSNQGRMFLVEPGTSDAVTIDSGTQGRNRIDLICQKITVNSVDGTQTGEWVVLKGTPTSETPTPPTVPVTDLDNGDTEAYLAVVKVTLSGINITAAEIVAAPLYSTHDLEYALRPVAEGYQQLTTPTSFTAPNPLAGRTAMGYGGYVRIGKLVIVDVVLMITSNIMTAGAKWLVASGMPIPRHAGAALSASLIGRYALTSCHVDGEGSVYVDTNVNLPSQFGITITGIYYAE